MTELNIDFSSLGQWMKEDIVNSCSSDNNKSIIMQPLSGCCNLYLSKKIMNLSRIKFHRWLDSDGKLKSQQVESVNKKKILDKIGL